MTDTPLHRLDHRAKLSLALLLCVALATAPRLQPLGAGGLAALALVAALMGRTPWAALRRAALVATPFVVALVLPAPFFEPGAPVAAFSVGSAELVVTDGGLALASTLLLKMVGALIAAVTLAHTAGAGGLLMALRAFRVPRLFVSVLAFTARYLTVLSDEARRMLRARRARGAARRPRIREAAALVGSIFVRAVERAERAHAAMLSRGWSGELHTLGRLRWRPMDTILSLVGAAAIGGLWFLSRRCG